MHPTGNPFSTRFVRPGQLEYLFVDGRGAGALVEQLRRSGWWGQIVGPHGSGKTTLLHTLAPLLEGNGRVLVWVTLTDGQQKLPVEIRDSAVHWQATTQMIIDGFEQLGWRARYAVKRQCRRVGAGLLITAHRSARVPHLYRTSCTLDAVEQIVQRLTRDDAQKIATDDLAQCYARHAPNVREVLFAIYDLYEKRRRPE